MTIPTGTMASRAKANTMRRQKLKTKWDKKCRYEAGDVDVSELPKSFEMEGQHFATNLNKPMEEDNWCRLLDEGVVVDNSYWTGEPYVYAVIKKGVIKEWYDSLPDDFVGQIDKDHNRSIDLGTFTKKDLRLVETGNGRYAVDVNVKLDHELYAVKDLIRANNRTALSVEMFCDGDEYATAEKVTGDKNEGKYLVPLISKLKIEAYAVCMAPKSANSYKDDLLEKAGSTNTNVTEEFSMNEDDDKKTVDVEVEEKVEETPTETPETETTEVDAAAAGEQNGAEPAPEGADEDATPEEPEATNDDESETEGDGETTLSAVKEQIEKMKAEIKAKDEKIAELEAQLSAKAKKEESFEAELTSILSMATSDEPTADEGGDATSDDEKTKSEEVDAYEAAFAELAKEN